ncbi:MAG: helix-turn-helix domain-containing protein [Bacteroidota bacterium]
MTVQEFNPFAGRYSFQLSQLETTFHSHPAIEVLFVREGHVTVTTEREEREQVAFAAIDANVKHKIGGAAETIETVFIEHRNDAVKDLLSKHGITMNQGCYTAVVAEQDLHSSSVLIGALNSIDISPQYDSRIVAVIDSLNRHEVAYEEMMGVLTEVAHLSPSRLSHLFRQEVGLSLKKYLLWCKLKATIEKHLEEGQDLFGSLIQECFYDHPHFSKAFRTMLGISPSKVYNSSTVQSSPGTKH